MSQYMKWVEEGFMDKGVSDITQGAKTAKDRLKKAKDKVKSISQKLKQKMKKKKKPKSEDK